MNTFKNAPESIRNCYSTKQSINISTREIVLKSILKMFYSSKNTFLFLFFFSYFLIVTAQVGMPGGYSEVHKGTSTFKSIEKSFIDTSETTNLQCGMYQNVKVTKLKEVSQQVVAGMNYEGFATATSKCKRLKCCIKAFRDLKGVLTFTICYCSRSKYPSTKKCFNK